MKFKLTDKSINSIDIMIINMFFLFSTKPITPIVNNTVIKNKIKFMFTKTIRIKFIRKISKSSLFHQTTLVFNGNLAPPVRKAALAE